MNLPETMRAAKLYGPMDLRLEEFPIPDLKPGQVLIKVTAVGVCPSGLKMLKDPSRIEPAFWEIPGFPGHETAGEVVQLGLNVKNFSLGDRVVPTAGPTCGSCRACRRGQFRFCENQDISAIESMSFSEYMVCDAEALLQIPKSLDDEQASFAEPLGCCIASVESCSVAPGDFAVVLGAGTMGLLHLQILHSLGARVGIIEPDPSRREIAAELGAEIYLAPEQAKEGVNRWTANRGADTVIVAAGSVDAVKGGLELVADGGTVMLFAGIWPPTKIEIDPNEIHYRQFNLTGSVGALMVDFERALALLESGAVQVGAIISERYPLTAVLEAHYASERLDTYKVIVRP
jgi:L-iditol 2-dehydrogenase